MVFLVLSIILISFVSAESIDVPSGLTAYWNFEGNGNNYLKDVAPSGQGIASDDAVDKDSATISLGRIGESSIELDGDKDYLEIASSEDVAPTDEISISGWFKLKSMGVGSKVITGSYISKRDSYILGPGDDGKISLFIYLENSVGGISSWREIRSEILPEINKWEHWTATYGLDNDGVSYARIYKNGKLAKEVDVFGTIKKENKKLCIGRDCNLIINSVESNDRYFHGFIDDVRIYNRPLTGREVLDVYFNNRCSDPSQVLFSISDSSNAHVSSTDGATIPKYSICYGDVFSDENGNPLKYTGANSKSADGRNTILRTSSSTNAHAEGPLETTNGYENIGFGTMGCEIVASVCQADTVNVLDFSSASNAHVSLPGFSGYTNKLCCATVPIDNTPKLEWWYEDGSTTSLKLATEYMIDKDNPYYFTTGVTNLHLILKANNYAHQEATTEVIEEDILLNPDDRIRVLEKQEISGSGQANFEWTISSTDVSNAGNEDVYSFFAEATLEDGTKVTSEILYAKESDVTNWICLSDRSGVRRTVDGTTETMSTISAILGDNDAKKAEAGIACKGLNANDPRDDCCPNNYYCTTNGCVPNPEGLEECQDYENENDCKADPNNLWRNVPAFVTSVQCNELENLNKCSWIVNNGVERCEYDVQQRKIEGGIIEIAGTCSYYHDEGTECTEGYKTVQVTATETPGLCTAALNECASGPQIIPCGRPAFELPFFEAWQIIIGLIVIMGLYLIMFKNKNLRKFLNK